jgi:exodeoxyribonuclease VII large subunit
MSKRIRHPRDQLQIIKNRLNELNQRNISSVKNVLLARRSQTNLIHAKIQQHNPLHQLKQLTQKFENINSRFKFSSKKIISSRSEKLENLIFTLDAVSPLHTLKRGYAIIRDDKNNIVRNVKDVKKNQLIKTELAKGSILSTITEINTDTEINHD